MLHPIKHTTKNFSDNDEKILQYETEQRGLKSVDELFDALGDQLIRDTTDMLYREKQNDEAQAKTQDEKITECEESGKI